MSAPIETTDSGTERGQITVALAAVVWSTAGVLQRQLSVGVATQVAGRALFAAVAVAAYVAVVERGRVREACRSLGYAGLGFAVSLAVASGAFIVALNHASVAQVLFIQSIAPVLAALLGRALLDEPVSRRTSVAMIVALLGVGVMVGLPGGGSALGSGLAVVMALGFAVGIVIARHRRDVSMAPATVLAQLMLLVVAAPFALAENAPASAPDVLWLVLLGAGQIGLGLILFTIGARLIPGRAGRAHQPARGRARADVGVAGDGGATRCRHLCRWRNRRRGGHPAGPRPAHAAPRPSRRGGSRRSRAPTHLSLNATKPPPANEMRSAFVFLRRARELRRQRTSTLTGTKHTRRTPLRWRKSARGRNIGGPSASASRRRVLSSRSSSPV
jgi:drug/metabolite transporter (DMT)-like permease